MLGGVKTWKTAILPNNCTLEVVRYDFYFQKCMQNKGSSGGELHKDNLTSPMNR